MLSKSERESRIATSKYVVGPDHPQKFVKIVTIDTKGDIFCSECLSKLKLLDKGLTQMECDLCHQGLMISRNDYSSDVGSADVYSELTLVCVNPNCAAYSGTDLNHPLHVSRVVRNKMN